MPPRWWSGRMEEGGQGRDVRGPGVPRYGSEAQAWVVAFKGPTRGLQVVILYIFPKGGKVHSPTLIYRRYLGFNPQLQNQVLDTYELSKTFDFTPSVVFKVVFC
jgi:hypothetical protein